MHASNPEQVTAEFRAAVSELEETPTEFIERLHKLGDGRSWEALSRSVQRMLSGESRVSGEMQALTTMMLRQQRRLQRQHTDIQWIMKSGCWSAQTGDFRLILDPQTKGRWRINVIYKSGYSHPWPRWQDSLERAKTKALVTTEDALDFIIEQGIIEERIAS